MSWRERHIYEVELNRAIGSWKRAWKYACSKAGGDYRCHDLRHTLVSRLAENPHVSEETIRSLAGHVSKQMLQRYSHIRTHDKEAAIAALEQNAVMIKAAEERRALSAERGGQNGPEIGEIETDGAQNSTQLGNTRLK